MLNNNRCIGSQGGDMLSLVLYSKMTRTLTALMRDGGNFLSKVSSWRIMVPDIVSAYLIRAGYIVT